jgi:HAD superfamily hydrolase (TIGR01509 family)
MTAAFGELQAVLFDMDGLLVDSEPAWDRVTVELVAELGGAWSAEDARVTVGAALIDSARRMVTVAGSDVPPEQVVAAMVASMEVTLRAGVTWRPGARELLAALAAAGVPTALVSASYRVLVDAVCSHLDAAPFAVTVAGDEVRRGKPHPEPYLTACARLGVDPAHAVVLEDSLTGATAGEAAGCLVVGVPHLVTLAPTARRRVVGSLHELSPAALAGFVRTGELASSPAVGARTRP